MELGREREGLGPRGELRSSYGVHCQILSPISDWAARHTAIRLSACKIASRDLRSPIAVARDFLRGRE